jgi:hypothetical protein
MAITNSLSMSGLGRLAYDDSNPWVFINTVFKTYARYT